jgi:fatty-acyl-CoA synthase
VHGVVVLREGVAATEQELVEWCRDKIAPYKRPRTISFLREDEMPRTATGKILHRVLKTQLMAK